METKKATFTERLTSLLNQCSKENRSDTPDYILAEYLLAYLKSFNRGIKERDRWYGVHLEPGNKYFHKDGKDENDETRIIYPTEK